MKPDDSPPTFSYSYSTSSELPEDKKIARLRASVGPGFGCPFDRVTVQFIDRGCGYDHAQLEAAVVCGESLVPPALMALGLCRDGVSYQEAKRRAIAQHGYWV